MRRLLIPPKYRLLLENRLTSCRCVRIEVSSRDFGRMGSSHIRIPGVLISMREFIGEKTSRVKCFIKALVQRGDPRIDQQQMPKKAELRREESWMRMRRLASAQVSEIEKPCLRWQTSSALLFQSLCQKGILRLRLSPASSVILIVICRVSYQRTMSRRASNGCRVKASFRILRCMGRV